MIIPYDQVLDPPPAGTRVSYNPFAEKAMYHHNKMQSGTSNEIDADKGFHGEKVIKNIVDGKMFRLEGMGSRNYVRNMVLIKGVDYE